MQPVVPTAAVISIGDEILRGDTLDTNMSFLMRELTQRGVAVRLGLTIPDVWDVIVAEVRRCAGGYTWVFTGGGIGPTPDDMTRPAVAEALGLDCLPDEEALRIYGEARGTPLNPGQREMCRLPVGCELIWASKPCPPGFIAGNVCVLPGVPAVLQDMWSKIAGRFHGPQSYEVRFRAEKGESVWAAVMQDFVDRYPALSFGSYPKIDKGWFADVLVRGYDRELVEKAAAEFEQAIRAIP